MSTAELELVVTEADPVEELARFLLENDASTEFNQWTRAELALRALAPMLPKATGQGSALVSALSFRSAGAYAVAESIAKAVADRGVLLDGKPPAARTLLTVAEVAHIWEPEERVAGASFDAHKALRSPKYATNRSVVLRRLAGKSKTGRVTEGDVAMWRSEKTREKRTPLTFQELFDRRIVHAIQAQVRPSFSKTTQDDLDAMAKTLRRRANQLEAGEQPKENN